MTLHAADGISPLLPGPILALSQTPVAVTTRWIVVGSVIAFLLVEVVVAWNAFRRRSAEPIPSPLRGFPRRRLEAAWMLTPAVILLSLVLWTSSVLGRDVRNAPGEPDLIVHVVGHQFRWELRYEIAGRQIAVADNQLHLPKGKIARIDLDAADVVHGFWVPQFRVKETLVPGASRTVWMQPMETGEFNIVCAELCGNSHYAMRGFVHVDDEAEFQKWLAGYAK